MKIGARVLKTGVAIVLTLLIVNFFNLEPGLIAAIAAVFALQPNIHRSMKTFFEQVQGNIVGAIAAVSMMLLFGNSIVVIGLTAIIVIALLQVLKLQSVSALAVITMIAILDAPTLAHSETVGDFFITAGERIALVMSGVVSSLIVNLVFIPPKYENRLYHTALNLASTVFKWMRLEINARTDYTVMKKDIKGLQEQVVKLETMYLWYSEERNYFRRGTFRNARKKILYQRLVSTTDKAFDLLKKLNRYQHDFHQLDEKLQYRMKVEIDKLMTHHEEIFMKFSGKIGPDAYHYTAHSEEHFDESMVQIFVELYEETHNNIEERHYSNILEIMSSIHDYSDALKHLDRMISSYSRFHSTENKLNISDETTQF